MWDWHYWYETFRFHALEIIPSLTAAQLYIGLFIAAPFPRAPTAFEKRYCHIESDGRISDAKRLPCWQDAFDKERRIAQRGGKALDGVPSIEEPEVFMSLVVPAYNEEDRLEIMLSEAVDFLQDRYSACPANGRSVDGKRKQAGQNGSHASSNGHEQSTKTSVQGWEILIVSDGSSDKTVEIALKFARRLGTDAHRIRVISLQHNRGKGGAVTHGMRHVRGQYAVFADADGASRFSDLGKLVESCEDIKDRLGRAVAVGSRAHLVGSEAVVKRSFVRNLLMHSFHLLLRLLTPPATGKIRDTQCGFKLFSRPSLPYIIPYMHSEGWIFDVEMLMLAETAGIPVAEVAIGWKEVKGSKLNVLWDSLGMAWGLAILRAAWGLRIYRSS